MVLRKLARGAKITVKRKQEGPVQIGVDDYLHPGQGKSAKQET